MGNNFSTHWITVAALATLGLAMGAAAVGGGSVNNRLPTIEAFAVDLTTNNAADTGVFTASVKDLNKEGDLVAAKLVLVNGPTTMDDVVRTFVTADLTALGNTVDDWKVWNSGTLADGVLSMRIDLPYPDVAGTYEFRLEVRDEVVSWTTSASISVTLLDKITLAEDPVDWEGVALDGANWGAWATDPGAKLVSSTNYIKVTNTGIKPTQSFTVDFSDAVFKVTGDANSTIGINGNVEFAFFESPSDADVAPKDGPAGWADPALGTWIPAPAGAVTLQFTDLDRHIHITYRIATIPEVARDEAYVASYTVDPV